MHAQTEQRNVYKAAVVSVISWNMNELAIVEHRERHTMVIVRKPESTSVLISSQPMPPAPTMRTLAAATCMCGTHCFA